MLHTVRRHIQKHSDAVITRVTHSTIREKILATICVSISIISMTLTSNLGSLFAGINDGDMIVSQTSGIAPMSIDVTCNVYSSATDSTNNTLYGYSLDLDCGNYQPMQSIPWIPGTSGQLSSTCTYSTGGTYYVKCLAHGHTQDGFMVSPGPIPAYYSTRLINVTIPTPVVGVCGSSENTATISSPIDNLCSTGTAGSVVLSGSSFMWSCTGNNGGGNVSCSAPVYISPSSGGGSGYGNSAPVSFSSAPIYSPDPVLIQSVTHPTCGGLNNSIFHTISDIATNTGGLCTQGTPMNITSGRGYVSWTCNQGGERIHCAGKK